MGKLVQPPKRSSRKKDVKYSTSDREGAKLWTTPEELARYSKLRIEERNKKTVCSNFSAYQEYLKTNSPKVIPMGVSGNAKDFVENRDPLRAPKKEVNEPELEDDSAETELETEERQESKVETKYSQYYKSDMAENQVYDYSFNEKTGKERMIRRFLTIEEINVRAKADIHRIMKEIFEEIKSQQQEANNTSQEAKEVIEKANKVLNKSSSNSN